MQFFFQAVWGLGKELLPSAEGLTFNYLYKSLTRDKSTQLPVSDETPVFHGTAGEVGNSDEVELVEGVGDVEVLGEEVQRFYPHVQRVFALHM